MPFGTKHKESLTAGAKTMAETMPDVYRGGEDSPDTRMPRYKTLGGREDGKNPYNPDIGKRNQNKKRPISLSKKKY